MAASAHTNQPHPQIGPLGMQSLSMSVEIEMKFAPGQKQPAVSVKQGARIHDTHYTLPTGRPSAGWQQGR